MKKRKKCDFVLVAMAWFTCTNYPLEISLECFGKVLFHSQLSERLATFNSGPLIRKFSVSKCVGKQSRLIGSSSYTSVSNSLRLFVVRNDRKYTGLHSMIIRPSCIKMKRSRLGAFNLGRALYFCSRTASTTFCFGLFQNVILAESTCDSNSVVKYKIELLFQKD